MAGAASDITQMLLETCDDTAKALRLLRTTMSADQAQFQAVAPSCIQMIDAHLEQLDLVINRAIDEGVGEG